MIKGLLKLWFDERMKAHKPPLSQDASIYILDFVSWADKQNDKEPLLRKLNLMANNLTDDALKDVQNYAEFLLEKSKK